jgi:RHS repeat-associated protein
VTNTVANGPNPDYSVWVDAKYSDGTGISGQAEFNIGSHDWQRAAATLTPTKPIQYVNVYVLFRGNNTGTVWFDNIRLQNGSAISSNTYDSNGYMTSSTDPLGNKTQTTYDSMGNKLTETDPKGNQKSFTYDHLNRLLSVSLPGYDIQIQYSYDKNGNITSKKATSKDGNSVYNQTNYSYYPNDQIKSVTDPLNNVTSYQYDANGNTSQVTNPDGTVESYQYDGADRKTDILWNGTAKYHFTYDTNGNETQVQDLGLNETKSMAYDSANRLTSVTTSGGSISYNYDSNDNLTKQTITNGSNSYVNQYGFNSINENTSVTDPAGRNYLFSFDENGNMMTFLNGNGAGSTYQYDDNNRVSHMAIGQPDGTNIGTFDYQYDANGNRTSVTTTDSSGAKTVNYTYDALNQLLSETDPTTGNTISYTYDPLGNRSTKVVKDSTGTVLSTTNYAYNAANELTSVGAVSYVYDKNGNLVDDGNKLYTWDTDGNLTEVKDKASGNVIVDYAYDEQGRRVSKTVNGVVTKYVYDGNSIRVLYETDASNQMTCYYTYNASGLLLSMAQIGGGTYFYHYNAHRDVIAVTDTSGKVVATYTYDAWGNLLSPKPDTGSIADQNPYRYAGYRYDPETGFYYLMARYYNPSIGRFLSQDQDPGDSDDPISQNGYTYANNNPIKFVDSDGNHFESDDGTGDPDPAIESEGGGGPVGIGIVSGIVSGVKAVGKAVVSTAKKAVNGVKSLFGKGTVISSKIAKQMGKRGWTEESINRTVKRPYTTRSAINKANGHKATAYFNKDGSYVVRDNKTGEIIQISNRNDSGWIPDPTIKNPYRPKHK